MKKRFIIFVATITLIIIGVITYCSNTAAFPWANKQVFDTEYNFDHAYIKYRQTTSDYDDWHYHKIKSWNDWEDSDMLQVITDDGSVYYTHSTNIVLVKEGKS